MLKYKIKSKLSLSYTYSNKNNKSIRKNPSSIGGAFIDQDQAELWITRAPSMRTGGLTKKSIAFSRNYCISITTRFVLQKSYQGVM
jgi:hypothetical protein